MWTAAVRAALGLCIAGAAAATPAQELTADEAGAVLQRAASEAQRRGGRAVVAVVDREARPVAVFRMSGAPAASVVAGQVPRGLEGACGREGFEGLSLPSEQAALSKAATAALLSTAGHAFSTRTAGFLMQERFPPGIDFTAAGPLFGFQFANLPCSGIGAVVSPFGLAADPGGMPLYRAGRVIGAVGVEGDGAYGVEADTFEASPSWEESAALAGASGFEPAASIRAESIVVEGVRLPYASSATASTEVVGVDGTLLLAPRASSPSLLAAAEIAGTSGTSPAGIGVRGGSVLSAAEVAGVIERALRQAERTRSALRRPLNSAARVTIAVVDAGGAALAVFRAPDAPLFGLGAAVLTARTAAFFSNGGAADALRAAGMAAFLQEVALDGGIAYTSRAIGFLAQPTLPPGVPGADPGPLSVGPPPAWSPFHTGLQSELLCDALGAVLAGVPAPACTRVPALPDGIALAPGGIPLYKDGRLAGAVGVSGDGPDQNDLIAAAGAAGLDAPPERRSDRLLVRGVRLPYVKFPRHPEL
jgi:uncharacterized protein GlcG (DUF336 family)